jgi:hypothetical protein
MLLGNEERVLDAPHDAAAPDGTTSEENAAPGDASKAPGDGGDRVPDADAGDGRG